MLRLKTTTKTGSISQQSKVKKSVGTICLLIECNERKTHQLNEKPAADDPHW